MRELEGSVTSREGECDVTWHGESLMSRRVECDILRENVTSRRERVTLSEN